MGSLGGWEIVIILGVLVLLFGAKKLPDMARSVGQSARVFKGEMKGMKADDGERKPEPPAAPGPGAAPVPPPGTPAASPSEETRTSPAAPPARPDATS